MAGKSDFLEEAVLNHIFRGTDIGANPGSTFIALFTVTPADDGTGGTEVTQAGYARAEVVSTTGNWKDPNSATQGQVENIFDIVFNPANEDWGTINAVGIYDAVTAGNLLYFDSSITATPVGTGGQVVIEPNQLIISED